MSLGKKRKAISRKVEKLYIYPITDPDTPVIDTAATWEEWSFVESANFMVDVSNSPEYNSGGQKLISLEGDENAYVEGIFKQRDKDLLDQLNESTKFVALCLYMGIVNGMHQEIFIPVCQMNRGINLGDNPPKPPFRFDILVNTAAVTIAQATAFHADFKHSDDVTIAAETLFEIEEEAVS